jgi:hypothetical protein
MTSGIAARTCFFRIGDCNESGDIETLSGWLRSRKIHIKNPGG